MPFGNAGSRDEGIFVLGPNSFPGSSDHPGTWCARAGSVTGRILPVSVFSPKEFEMKKVITLALAIVLGATAISSIGCSPSEPTKAGTTATKK